MSQTTGHRLLRYVRELRHSVIFYHDMERQHPDRAPYYRGRRKIAFCRGLEMLDFAREELATQGKSDAAIMWERAHRKPQYVEAAE